MLFKGASRTSRITKAALGLTLVGLATGTLALSRMKSRDWSYFDIWLKEDQGNAVGEIERMYDEYSMFKAQWAKNKDSMLAQVREDYKKARGDKSLMVKPCEDCEVAQKTIVKTLTE
mmetsp:Transcript_571/g.873  ORF Transcript_571/g.873 Transcript_571/m.873 type:complete len:117 (+) Transcript_571:64-414(+)